MELTEQNIIFTRPHKTLYAVDNKIVKIFDSSYKKSDVLNEARNEALVEESAVDLNIPTLLEVSETPKGWCLIRQNIEGQTLDELMKAHPEKMAEYLERFVDLQLLVHAQKVPTIKRLRHKLMDQINLVRDVDATCRYELSTRLQSMPKHTKLCHGDFNPTNVIITADDQAYIIDWAHAAQGNASADAANTYLYFALQDSTLAEQYLSLYCKKSDTARQYVNRWMSIVAAAQLTKKKESEKEFLLKWTDVVEYE